MILGDLMDELGILEAHLGEVRDALMKKDEEMSKMVEDIQADKKNQELLAQQNVDLKQENRRLRDCLRLRESQLANLASRCRCGIVSAFISCF